MTKALIATCVVEKELVIHERRSEASRAPHTEHFARLQVTNQVDFARNQLPLACLSQFKFEELSIAQTLVVADGECKLCGHSREGTGSKEFIL